MRLLVALGAKKDNLFLLDSKGVIHSERHDLNPYKFAFAQTTEKRTLEDALKGADVFLSIGTEGFGIPVLEAIALGTPVAYAGIQPAGDIMEGKGAIRLEGLGTDELADSFVRMADRTVIDRLQGGIRADAIPQWREFARIVCEGVLVA